MCSGKTTLGRALAERLGREFIDLDDAVERRSGRSVAEIFATDGEAAFRHLERETLDDILLRAGNRSVVVACGGGTPCREGVMEVLNGGGVTVWLVAPVERIVERVLLEPGKRPLLAGKSREELTRMVGRMLDERRPYYSQAAHTFDASLLESESQVAESVTDFIARIPF